MKRKTGERSICKLCDQEIEWVGHWHDRGGNTTCPPYKGPDGEIIDPGHAKKHKPNS